MRIQISQQYPFHWEYNDQPVMLIGGSVEDNLFQIPDLEDHLRLLASVGGNYVRCTMSSRDPGDVWPFEKTADGLYDLDQPSAEFWGRFQKFLALTRELDIIAQIEVWATFDFYRDCWDANPFNPKNNINYTADESKLPLEVTTHPVRTENPFFWSIPAEHHNTVVLKYQQAFVDELLKYALDAPNILYCMDNETSVTPEWGAYWSNYIKSNAGDRHVETTEMWDAHDLSHEQHSNTFEHPETYSFVDVSQNNHQVGQVHWDNAQLMRQRIASTKIRPLNNVKIYGADTGRYGTTADGIDRLWRNIFGKMASARFHRPDAGIGLSAPAQTHLRAARMLLDAIDVFPCQPHNDLLSERADDGAYCMAEPGKVIAVYFPRPGGVMVDTRSMSTLSLRWLNIQTGEWSVAETMLPNPHVQLETPYEGRQVAVLTS